MMNALLQNKRVSIIPIDWETKRPLIAEWKQFQQVPPTDEKILNWQNTLKPLAWGIVLGKVSDGLYVADLDSENAEETVIARIFRSMFKTYVVESSPGKRHWYFYDRNASKLATHNYRNEIYNDPLICHVDLKGEGGYVLKVGSKHPKGSEYKIVDDLPITEALYDQVHFLLHTLHKHWPILQKTRQYFSEGARHLTTQGLSGLFYHYGFTIEEGVLLVSALCYYTSQESFLQEAQLIVQNTYRRAEDGYNISFKEYLPEVLVDELIQLPKRTLYGSLQEEMIEQKILDTLPPQSESEPLPSMAQKVVEEKIVESKIAQKYQLTDLGNGMRLMKNFGKDIRYCKLWGKWLVWDGKRWRWDNNLQIRRLAFITVRKLYEEIDAAMGKEERNEIIRWARTSESAPRIDGMLRQAEAINTMLPEQFDRDQWLLNVENGTVDLHTGKLMGHKQENYISMLAPVVYEPAAACPIFHRFLERVLPDAEVREHFQLWLGYALTGDMSMKGLRIDWGPTTDNGKSTLYNIIKALLGDYAETVPFDTLLERDKPHSPKNDLASLVGKRLVMATESKSSGKLDTSTIKLITGRDPIRCRFLFHEYFTYNPTYKIWLMGNERPNIDDDGDAIWNRVHLVHWRIQIPKHEQDIYLADKIITSELSGILNWALEGCLKWQRFADIPKVGDIEEETQKYRLESDKLYEFIKEMFEEAPTAETQFSHIWTLYKIWTTGRDVYPMGPAALGRRLERRYRKTYRNGYPFYCGLKSKTDTAPSRQP